MRIAVDIAATSSRIARAARCQSRSTPPSRLRVRAESTPWSGSTRRRAGLDQRLRARRRVPRGDRHRHRHAVLAWISGALEERGWTLKLIVSTHGHWDHIGDNAAVAHTGADIAVHPATATTSRPAPFPPPFEIVPSVPAVELAEGGEIRFGAIRLQVLHTPGHTPGSVCLLDVDEGLLFSGDTLFAGGVGTHRPARRIRGGDRRRRSPASPTSRTGVRVLPGHGPATTIGRERAWLDMVRREGGCRSDGTPGPRAVSPSDWPVSRRGDRCPSGRPCPAPAPCRAPCAPRRRRAGR